MKKNLTKSERIRLRSEMNILFSQSLRLTIGGLSLFYRSNICGHSRFFVGTKKGFAHAPARNRARRLLREVLRLQKEHFPPSWDMAWVLSPSFSLTFDQLKKAVHTLREKAFVGALKENIHE